jgi:hypothetical protein
LEVVGLFLTVAKVLVIAFAFLVVDSYMNVIPAVPPNPAMPRPCATVYQTSNYCATAPAGDTNGQIFDYEYGDLVTGLFPSYELFAHVFEHIHNPNGYTEDPYLEEPLAFLPGMIMYIQGLIAAPPSPVH